MPARPPGKLPAAVEAWRQALQVLNDLGWPDLLGIGARLEQARGAQPAGLIIKPNSRLTKLTRRVRACSKHTEHPV